MPAGINVLGGVGNHVVTPVVVPDSGSCEVEFGVRVPVVAEDACEFLRGGAEIVQKLVEPCREFNRVFAWKAP